MASSRKPRPGYDVAWLRAQLAELRTEALANAKEDNKRAREENDEGWERAASAAEHYADHLQRILDGKTFEQVLAERLKRSRRAS